MSFPFAYFESIKKSFDYWRTFKGKRVRIWLRRGMRFTKAMMLFGDSIEMDFLDNVEGTISKVVESPFGIMLKDIFSTHPDEKNIEMIFIPMPEIAKIDFFKQSKKA